jgi:hypothetical protein
MRPGAAIAARHPKQTRPCPAPCAAAGVPSYLGTYYRGMILA